MQKSHSAECVTLLWYSINRREKFVKYHRLKAKALCSQQHSYKNSSYLAFKTRQVHFLEHDLFCLSVIDFCCIDSVSCHHLVWMRRRGVSSEIMSLFYTTTYQSPAVTLTHTHSLCYLVYDREQACVRAALSCRWLCVSITTVTGAYTHIVHSIQRETATVPATASCYHTAI